MAVRTQAAAVKAVLIKEYDTVDEPTLIPFIDTASAMVDWLVTCDTGSTLSASELELIERWLAAHCYKSSDQATAEEKVGDAQAKYQGKTGWILYGTKYGQMALMLDHTGCLAKRSKEAEEGKKVAGVAWLGLDVSEQQTPND